MKIYVTVEGIDREIADLKQFGAKAHEDLIDLVKSSGASIATQAAARSPYSTGAMRASIGVKLSKSKLTAFIRPKKGYGVYQEYGTGSTGVAHTFVSMKDTSDTTPLKHKIPMGFPSVKRLTPWALRHGLNPFLVARAIWRKQGIRAKQFVTLAGESVAPEFVSGVGKILEDQAAEYNAKR